MRDDRVRRRPTTADRADRVVRGPDRAATNGIDVRNSKKTCGGARAALIAAGIVLTGTLVLSGCTNEPDPPTYRDELQSSATTLREQLEQVDGLADVSQTISSYELTIEFAIDDPARAEAATLEALELIDASGVREVVSNEAAANDIEAAFALGIAQVGSNEAGPRLRLPISSEMDASTIARGVATWTDMGEIDGIELDSSSLASTGFTMRYTVGYEGLLAGVRPTAVTPQLIQILTANGYDPAASTITPSISAPEAVNSVGGEEKYVQGTRLARAHMPMKAAAGPNWGSVLYIIPSTDVVDMYLLPALAPDGALLPLDLTADSVVSARAQIQADHFRDAWSLRDVIVFTEQGTDVFGANG